MHFGLFLIFIFILTVFICLAARGSMEPSEPGAGHRKGVSPPARGHGCEDWVLLHTSACRHLVLCIKKPLYSIMLDIKIKIHTLHTLYMYIKIPTFRPRLRAVCPSITPAYTHIHTPTKGAFPETFSNRAV